MFLTPCSNSSQVSHSQLDVLRLTWATESSTPKFSKLGSLSLDPLVKSIDAVGDPPAVIFSGDSVFIGSSIGMTVWSLRENTSTIYMYLPWETEINAVGSRRWLWAGPQLVQVSCGVFGTLFSCLDGDDLKIQLDLFDTITLPASTSTTNVLGIAPYASSHVFIPSDWIGPRQSYVVRSSIPIPHPQHHLIIFIRLIYSGPEAVLAVSPEGYISLLSLEGRWEISTAPHPTEAMLQFWLFDGPCLVSDLSQAWTVADGELLNSADMHVILLKTDPAKPVLIFPLSEDEEDKALTTGGVSLRSGIFLLLPLFFEESRSFTRISCAIARFD